jgi:hypothetical protein
MKNEEEKGRINIEKEKILAILPDNQELQGNIFNVKLYSSDKEGEDWLFSGLEGNLCLIVDYQIKTKYLIIYHPINYEKVFQYELYINFDKYFEELAPDFRSFEIDSGFIGLQFDNQDYAKKFEQILMKTQQMKNIFNKALTKENIKKQNQIYQKYCKKLKEKFSDDESIYDENYAEDGTQILKHRNFKVLNNISYDKEQQKFKFGKISDELKQMFLSFGIKKKELERDVDFAFTLFKKVIVGLGSENKLKNSTLDNIEHFFPPPEEREIQRRNNELEEAKKINRTQKKIKSIESNPKIKSIAATKRCSVPLAPPPPPPPPPISSVPSAPHGPIPRVSAPEVDVAIQIQNMKLKKVVKEEKQEKKDKNIGGDTNFLQNALSTAIRNRRNNLHMHDEDNEEEEEDDWD